jgi:integrase
MPRIRKGTEVEKNGKWYGRVRYTTLEGKRKDLWLPAKNKSEASELVQKKLHELKTIGEQAIDGDKIKFSDLAKIYKEKKLIPAQYVGERKVAGLRSYQNPVRFLATLTDYFGNRRIKTITHSSIEEYKLMRLNLPTKRGQRQIASVNRELELLRAILKYAVRENWILRSPFEMGAPLISKADETRRERILTHEEERRLLNVCSGRCAHLKPLIIAALNTGCRRGELFKLKWKQVDLSSNIISILAMNSKTARPRLLPITPQLNWELEKLWQVSNQDSENLVFGILDTVKKSWKSVCRIAEIEDLRFHDLRHTAITRMVQAGIASAIVMKLSGHTQHATFARYVNPNSEAIASAAEMLAAFNSQQGTQESLELVN